LLYNPLDLDHAKLMHRMGMDRSANIYYKKIGNYSPVIPSERRIQ